MEQFTVNNEMKFECPDGFRILSEEEVRQMNSLGGAPAYVLKNEDKHIIVSFACKEENGLAAMMVNAKDMVKKMADSLKKANQPYGYQQAEYFSRKFGSEKAEGLCYSYTVQGIGMNAQAMTVKHGKTFYYVYVYYRKSLKEESLPVIEEVLNSVTFE